MLGEMVDGYSYTVGDKISRVRVPQETAGMGFANHYDWAKRYLNHPYVSSLSLSSNSILVVGLQAYDRLPTQSLDRE